MPIDPAARAEHGPECWLAGHWERRHGSRCTCRLLAAASGADPSAVDYGFCRRILQQRWRMSCDHLPRVYREKATPKLPPHDPRDPLHALLIANADFGD
ncbi:MAG: hypothetical protein WAO95_03265 [Burkholderiales bacterium]